MDSKIEPEPRGLYLEATSYSQDSLCQCYPSCENKLFHNKHNFVCLEQSKREVLFSIRQAASQNY